MNPNSHFDNLDAWRQNQARPWNRLRYLLVEANLQRVIGDSAPLRVIDVGGGDGRDALPLALRGHNVLVLDDAPAMLAETERRAKEAGAGDRICTQRIDVAGGELPVAVESFDLVLCHNVLQYLPDPAHLLRLMANTLRPGGWLSLLIPNPASETLRHALQQRDLPAALASLDATTHCNHFYGVEMHLYDLPALWAMLAAAGLTPIEYHGVRCVNDYIGDDAVKSGAEGFERLLALEQAMGTRSPYRDIARLWQIIARK